MLERDEDIKFFKFIEMINKNRTGNNTKDKTTEPSGQAYSQGNNRQ